MSTDGHLNEWMDEDVVHTCTHTHTYRNINQSLKKNEILPSMITHIELEGITLNEVSQTKPNTIQSHFYVESKTQKKHKVTKNQAHG